MCRKNFQYDVHIPRKCIESRHFYSSTPSALKILPQVLIITHRQREITHFPRQHFFENLLPPTGERDGGN